MLTILDLLPAGSMKHAASTDGGEWCGPCPRCGGHDRFHAWPHKGQSGKFWCRACGWSGDGIAFIMERDGVGYVEACRRFGTAPRTGRRPLVPQQKAAWAPKPSLLPCSVWQATASAFVTYAAGVMATDAQGQAYAMGRGLTPETIQTLGIGWNPSTVYDPRASWGLPYELNPETGHPRKVWVARGLVVPTFHAGRVVALKIRRSDWRGEDDPLPKYAAIKGSAQGPMILAEDPGKPVAIVEGELDAILLHQAVGDLVTAMAMRSAKIKPDTEAHALLMAAPTILCALDADPAGYEGWLWWRDAYRQAKRWPPILGKDPGEAMKAGLDLRVWIIAGLSPDPQPQHDPIPVPARRDGLPAWAL